MPHPGPFTIDHDLRVAEHVLAYALTRRARKANCRVPGIDIGVRFKNNNVARLQEVLPSDDRKKAKDNAAQRSCNGDDDTADFVVSDEILTAVLSEARTLLSELGGL